MSNPKRHPSLTESVHYLSFGTPAGEYKPTCRAAVVTEVTDQDTVSLAVLNPSGLFFDRDVHYSPIDKRVGGSWHWEH